MSVQAGQTVDHPPIIGFDPMDSERIYLWPEAHDFNGDSDPTK